MYEDFFAERLAALRTQKRISAREMSLAIGQNASYINRIENKLAFPSMQCFFYICEYLEITPMEFFNTEVKNPSKINQVIAKVQTLSDEQIDLIIAVSDALQKNK